MFPILLYFSSVSHCVAFIARCVGLRKEYSIKPFVVYLSGKRYYFAINSSKMKYWMTLKHGKAELHI